MSKINSRIKELRKKLNKTQDEFSSQIGLSRNFIAQIEIGTKMPSDRTINDICREFHVNENWLKYGEGEMFLPIKKEKDLAKLSVDLLMEESDSFKSRFISLLARMTDEEWALLESMVEKLASKKE